MITDCTWAIGGEAGFGIMSAGTLLAKACSRDSYSVIAINEYPSLIRGGHNFVSLRISTEEVFAPKQTIDILVALNKETVMLHKGDLSISGLILFDPKDGEVDSKDVPKGVVKIPIPLSEIVRKLQGDQVMRNTIAIGASMFFLGKNLDVLSTVIADVFAKKGKEVIDENIAIANEGYTYAKEHFKDVTSHILAKGSVTDKKLIMNVSEAVGLGALAGGMKFAAIYPMTPINALIPMFSDNAKKFGIIYKQPEDEIAGINMAIGASLAGARSLVATSGGGFALMEEAVSMAGIMEVPLVIDLGMRPGPATGMPTWTEQGELFMAIHAGHGDFPRIVLAPGDVEEAYSLTKFAFDLADMFHIPVFILTDKYLNETQWQISSLVVSSFSQVSSETVVDEVSLHEGAPFKRYDVSVKNGVSKRSFPGMKHGDYLANSYEHEEDGYTTEDADIRIQQVDKRLRKVLAITNKAMPPISYGVPEADVTFITFGSVKGVVRQAVQELILQKKKVKQIHFSWVYPLHKDTKALLEKERRCIVVEQNATGQLQTLLQMDAHIEIKESWKKYSGRQWTVEEVIEKYKQLT